MKLKINKIQHIGIPITNSEKSLSFYERFGFEIVMHSEFMHNGGKGKVWMMKQGDIIIELYLLPVPELEIIKNRKYGCIDHFAINVDNINETFHLLKENGFSIDEAEPVLLNFWNKGCMFFNVNGPDGERIEFCQIL
ncbi:MAG: VOC family protein [Bacteroidales bacterium]|nr:VOC family protein [Bacteroidales bacterium]